MCHLCGDFILPPDESGGYVQGTLTEFRERLSRYRVLQLNIRMCPGPAISNRGKAFKDAYRLIEGMIWKQYGYLSATNVRALYRGDWNSPDPVYRVHDIYNPGQQRVE